MNKIEAMKFDENGYKSEEIQVVVADSSDISTLLDKLMVQQKLELDLLK